MVQVVDVSFLTPSGQKVMIVQSQLAGKVVAYATIAGKLINSFKGVTEKNSDHMSDDLTVVLFLPQYLKTLY